MAMEGPILCRPAMQAKLPAVLISNSLTKSGQLGTALFGANCRYRNTSRCISPISQPSARNPSHICCSFSSSSDGNGYMAGNFSESDEDYVNSTVLEAVEVRSGSEGYVIKMRDGKNLRCVHNNSQGRNIPESAPQPAIVLRIEDGSETLLPIIVLEMPSVLLMAAIRNVHIARPTIYQVVKEMIDKMGYEVKLVRVNKRVQEAYCAELYLTKIEDPTDSITFDLRPSDAINIAVRCKVPVQVHRSLAYSDGIRPVEPARMAVAAGLSEGLLFTELDRPDGQPCVEAQEFGLVRNMLIAAVEERYKDAGNDTILLWLQFIHGLKTVLSYYLPRTPQYHSVVFVKSFETLGMHVFYFFFKVPEHYQDVLLRRVLHAPELQKATCIPRRTGGSTGLENVNVTICQGLEVLGGQDALLLQETIATPHLVIQRACYPVL